jgi:hypothetical protein
MTALIPLTVAGVAPGVRTATFNTDAFINDGERVGVSVVVTPVSGTGPTLNCKLQFSPDGGTTWADLDATNAITANLTAAGNQTCWAGPGLPVTASKSANCLVPRILRVAVTIGGTTPSFTITALNAHVA